MLRQVLAQAYFWNGLRDKAIDEYRHILENHAYHSIKDMENRSSSLLAFIDRYYLLSDFFSRIPASAQAIRSALSNQLSKFQRARAVRDDAQKAVESARAQAQKSKPAEAARAGEAAQAAEGRLQASEKALGEETDSLARTIADSRAHVEQFSTLWLARAVDKEQISALQETDRAAEDSFSQVTKTNHWVFDRAATLAEIAPDVKDNALARLVTAKLFLMDRQTSAAQRTLSSDAAGQAGTETAGAPGALYTLAQARLWAGQAGEGASPDCASLPEPGPRLRPPIFCGASGARAVPPVPVPGLRGQLRHPCGGCRLCRHRAGPCGKGGSRGTHTAPEGPGASSYPVPPRNGARFLRDRRGHEQHPQ